MYSRQGRSDWLFCARPKFAIERFFHSAGTIPVRSRLMQEETLQELMMPIILWLMGVPLVVVVLLMLTHVI
jgi:hypothetical protein